MPKFVDTILLLVAVLFFHITISNAKNIKGIVTPISPCGGSWFPWLRQVRFTNCEGAPPCTVRPFTEQVLEVEFEVRDETTLIRFILDIQTYLGNVAIVDSEMEVVPWANYNIRQSLIISNALSGQSATLFGNIYDVTNSRLAMCAQLPINIS